MTERWDERDFEDVGPERVVPSLLARHPMLPVAICLILGILTHSLLPPMPWAGLGAAATLAVAVLVLRGRLAQCCAGLAVLAVGFAAGQMAHYRFASHDIGHFASDERRLAWLEFEFADDPKLQRPADLGRPRPPRMTALVDVTAIRLGEDWTDATGQALFQLYTPTPHLRAGQRVRALVWLERPGPAMNPGQFDFQNFYRSRRILASISCDSAAGFEVVTDQGASPLTTLRGAASDLLVAGFGPRDVETAALLRAMLLGERDPAMSDARELFRASGTSHYLAVSGLHVAVVAGAGFLVLRGTGSAPKWCVLGGLSMVLAYAAVAAPAPPVLRAAIVATTFAAGLLMGRRTAGVQLLAIAAVALLLIAPLDVYRAGFQLSFVTVLGLLVLGESMRRRLVNANASDTDLPSRSDGSLVRAGRWLDRRMISGLSAAVVAWLASMPLVALHFGQFNTWAIPASLAAAPAVVASLVGGVLKILLTLLFPDSADLWANLVAVPVRLMRGIVAWFAARPGADVPLPVPGVLLVGGFYGALLLAKAAKPRPGRRFPTSAVAWAARGPLVVVALLVFIFPLLAASRGSDDGSLRVTLLAVGAGQCAVIETPAGEVTLIDAGSSSLGRPLEQCIGPFLRSRGHNSVGRVIVSHANFDHYNAVADAVDRYRAGEVLVGHGFVDDAGEQPAGRELLHDLATLDRPPRQVAVGDVIPLGRDTRLRILWPPADTENLSANDASLVLKLEHAGRTVLFTGDIQDTAMDALLALDTETPGLLACDVMVAPHHGSTESATARFVARADPSLLLSSNGRSLARKQVDLADRIGPRRLLRTHDRGAITLAITPDGEFDVSTFLDGDERPLLTYPE